MADIFNAGLAAIKSIRIQDILDMAIIAGMIFALLMWFKTRASRFVLIGILLLGGVYLAARFFQLYLTVIVLQGFFAILLFVLVVIFQEDLRGFFERLALLGNLRKDVRPLSALEQAAGILAETAGNLAKKRIGALIVIAGEDPLERHLNGGVALGGAVSEPILSSIFDPHSDGHDGAVVIKDDRIIQFGCHLPLSIKIDRYDNIGLRHTAALGLADRTDALCIVVSEERGTISVARGESLSVVQSPSALNEILEKHYLRFQPGPAKRPLSGWLRENTKEKIIAVGLAFLFWVAFGYQREMVRRDFIIPIEYKNVPQHWQIDEPQLNETKVVLEGSEQAFRLLSENSLRLSLDLSAIQEKKREFVLTRDMINAPSNLSIAEITPAKIRIYASRMVPATLPVHIVTQDILPDGLMLHKMAFKPTSVRVLIHPRLKPEDIRLETAPIDLRRITSTVNVETTINPTSGVAFPDGKPPVITVMLRVKKK